MSLQFLPFEAGTNETRMVSAPFEKDDVLLEEVVYEQTYTELISVGRVRNVIRVSDTSLTAFALIHIENAKCWESVKEGCLTGVVRLTDGRLVITHPICIPGNMPRDFTTRSSWATGGPIPTIQAPSPTISALRANLADENFQNINRLLVQEETLLVSRGGLYSNVSSSLLSGATASNASLNPQMTIEDIRRLYNTFDRSFGFDERGVTNQKQKPEPKKEKSVTMTLESKRKISLDD